MLTLGIMLMILGPLVGAGISAFGGILNAKDNQKQQKDWELKQEYIQRDQIDRNFEAWKNERNSQHWH